MFTELSRRMGLPLFASARRSAALADRVLDDEVIAESMLGQDLATISTESGSCTATVRVTERIRIGVVSLPHGVGSSDVNQLTSSAGADSLSAMPVLSRFPVAVSASSPSG